MRIYEYGMPAARHPLVVRAHVLREENWLLKTLRGSFEQPIYRRPESHVSRKHDKFRTHLASAPQPRRLLAGQRTLELMVSPQLATFLVFQ